MKIAILEITTHGHYALVESITKIYTSIDGNEIVIYTTEKGGFALQGIENDRVKIVIVHENIETLFSNIKGFDRVFIPTLEAYSRVPYRIMQIFLNTNFGCPIYYFIHNVDFWFQQSFLDRLRNVFYRLSNANEFIYRMKMYFNYALINPKVVQKVKESGGKLVALTDSVGRELSKYIDNEYIYVIPFSVFDGRIINKSREDTRLRVCIPGHLSPTRRDYDSVFKMMTENKDFFKQNIIWDFLGGNPQNRESKELIDKIHAHQEQGHDIRYYKETFLSMEDYDSNLAKADVILGNMYLQQGVNSRYGKSKETGIIFTMIKASKVGILPKDYSADIALKTSILTFKNYKEVAHVLQKLIDNPKELTLLKIAARENSYKFTPLSIYLRLENN